MQTYILCPVPGLSERELSASTYHGAVMVEAINEWSARQLVTLNFGIATKSVPGEQTVTNIWNDPSASTCEVCEPQVVDQEFEAIEPPKWLEKFSSDQNPATIVAFLKPC